MRDVAPHRAARVEELLGKGVRFGFNCHTIDGVVLDITHAGMLFRVIQGHGDSARFYAPQQVVFVSYAAGLVVIDR